MPITLKNSPIVELIAEMRWDVDAQPIVGAAQGMPVGIVSDVAECEAFFMNFIGHAFQAGYPKIERLVPNGYPLLLHQPVLRFRPKDGGGLLLQVGPGILTVNATPPYKTWNDFAPEIEKSLSALFASRTAAENEKPFSTLNLRYIDAFDESLTRDMDIATFMRDVLSVDVQLPVAVTKHSLLKSAIKPSLQIQIPMHSDRVMSLGIGEGIANGKPAFMMDTTVSLLKAIAPDAGDVMSEFAASRGVIHEMFFDLTLSIRELMQPEGSDE